MSAQSPAMAGPDLGPAADDDDDLPRTVRREKEARAREARERAAQERAAAPTLSSDGDARPRPQIYRDAGIDPDLDDMPPPATVRRFDVSFAHLATFFLKAVVAAIPALIVLGIILWFAGAALEMVFPQLIKMKILISFPN